MKTRELELAKSLKSMEIEIVEGGGQQAGADASDSVLMAIKWSFLNRSEFCQILLVYTIIWVLVRHLLVY